MKPLTNQSSQFRPALTGMTVLLGLCLIFPCLDAQTDTNKGTTLIQQAKSKNLLSSSQSAGPKTAQIDRAA